MRDKVEKYFNIQDEIEVLMEISGKAVYDFSCFGVDSKNSLCDERYMIFYNQRQAPNNEIVLEMDNEQRGRFKVHLDKLPNYICRLVFTVTIDGDETMSTVDYHKVSVLQNGSDGILLNLTGKEFASEKAIISIEIYKKDCWRIAAVANGFNEGLSALLRYFGGVEEIQSKPDNKMKDDTLDTRTSKTETINEKDNRTEAEKISVKNNESLAKPQASINVNEAESGIRTSSHQRTVAYRVVIVFNNRLESISIDGDEMEDISAIQDKQIEDWFVESTGRSGWRGLIFEIKEQVGDDQAELNFEFQGPKEYREIFEKCLGELGFGASAAGMSKDEIAQLHMKDAKKAEHRKLFKQAFESYKKAADYGDLAEAQYKVGEYYYQCYKGEFEGIKLEQEDALAKAIAYCEKAAEQGNTEAKHQLFVILDERELFEEAFQWVEELAKNGEMQAQYELGNYYNKGKGVAQDLTMAASWYQASAKQGYAPAQNNLGDCYKNGTGVEKDEVKAVALYIKAAEQGDAAAQNSLGNCYENGIGIEEDEKKAFEWYEKAATQGYAIAQYNLGNYYEGGWVVEQDKKKAIEWYEKSAKQTYVVAQKKLGDCYKNGYGVEKDVKKAFEWYEKSAMQGYVEAQRYLGYCYYWEVCGVAKDEKKSFEWYKKAAIQGDAVAQKRLGDCYFCGTGTEENEAKSVQWYKRAEKAKKLEEWVRDDLRKKLGECYMFGIGVEKDEKKAFEWYERAAIHRNTEAINKLGDCYRYGIGVEKDEKKAFECYDKVQGYEKAQNNLGDCYRYGIGVEKDEKEAFEWYMKAAKQRYAPALKNISDCYKYGIGIEIDEWYMKRWYARALENGYKENNKNVREIVELYKKAAEQGDVSAQNNLGDCYRYGIGVEEDEYKAFGLYTKAAKQGYALAIYNIGNCCEHGIGSRYDMKEAIVWYESATKKGYAPAQDKLGDCYYFGQGVEEDKKKAFEWYKKGAEQGYAPAQGKLGDCYYFGQGVEEDKKKAFEWYKKGAEQGDALAQGGLGNCYFEMHDLQKAFEWCNKGAAQGDSRARAYLETVLFVTNKHIDPEWKQRWKEEDYLYPKFRKKL